MNTNALPITCNGQEFSSFKEFANYYGLHYTKAQYYRKRGKTPEEILEICKFTSHSKTASNPKPSAKRYLCEYNGVQYGSLNEAACALGFSPSQIYELRRRNNVSPSAAIEMAMEQRLNKGEIRKSGNHKKCIIDGVEYESQEAALRAYKIPGITVYSRMEREGITFEEALVRGRKANLHCPPVGSLFSSLRLTANPEEQLPDTLKELKASLEYYQCKVKPLRDLTSQLPVLLVNDENYIYFNHEAKGIEIVSELPCALDLETINLLNSAYVATKIFAIPQTKKSYLMSFQIAKEEAQGVKALLYSYFSFTTTKESLQRSYTA